MNKISRDELKKKGFKRFLHSWKNSFDGYRYAYKNEQSMLIHAFCTFFAIVFGIIFKITFSEWAIIFIALGFILATELINTAIEAVVDLVTLEIHPLAKIAKDCGSAATLTATLVAVAISMFVFGPYFLELFGIVL